MGVVSQEIILPAGSNTFTVKESDRWQPLVEQRINNMASCAYEVPFDNHSRFVFFSDCHRGDNGRTDAFTANEQLFLHALT
jgi:hypothetical protein